MAKRKDETIQLGIEIDQQAIQKFDADLNARIEKVKGLSVKLAQSYIDSKAAADKAKSSFDASFSSIEKNTKAAKEFGNEIDKVKTKAESVRGFNLGGVESRVSQIGGAIGGIFGNEVAAPVRGVGDVLQLVDSLKELPGQLGLASEGATSAAASFGAVASAAAPLVTVLGPIALGAAVLYGEVKKGQSAIEAGQKGVEAYYTAIQTGTEESINEQIKSLEAQRTIQEKIRDANQGAIDNFYDSSREATGALEAAAYAFVDLTGGINPLKDKVSGAQQQIDELSIVINALKEASEDALPSQQAYVDSILEGVSEANKAIEEEEKIWHEYYQTRQEMAKDNLEEERKLAEEQAKRDSAMVDILKKRDADIENIETTTSQARVELQKRTAETIEKIIQSSIDANERAFQQLQDQQSKLLLDASRADDAESRKAAFDELQLQIDDNRKERDELKAHQKRVRDIRNGDRAAERDAEYDRNFDALFRLQERKAEQEDIENQTFQDQKEARLQAQKDEREDTARQRQFERNERRIALQNALNDARAGYMRELEQNRQAKEVAIALARNAAVAELNLINSKTAAEIEMRRQGAINEINLISQTEAVKQQIFIKYLNEARAILGQSHVVYQNPNVEGTAGGTIYQSSRSTGVTLRQYADGGAIRKGQLAEVNEWGSSGRESFGGMMFPGHGYFIPSRDGYINANKGGDTYNFNNTFTGNNPQAIAKEVDNRLAMRLKGMQK